MAKQHLLLVDADAKSLRVMEVSLKKAGFQVTTAIHGKDALEKVQISPPDLVLSETRMPEMDGLELCKVLKSDERFRGIPFVFLTSQKGVEVKVRGLEQGADDYLTKPIYIKEVVTRVRMILQKVEKDRSDRKETKNGFVGNLADMGVVDLVQTFEIGRKTGTVKLEGDRAGVVYFKEGRVIDAELGRLRGENAFYRMLNTFEGKFEVSFVPSDRPERIEVSTQGLLMEGMRRLDEWGRMLEQLPPLETVFELDYAQLSDRLAEIPDEVNGLLRLFDGRRTLSRVVDDSDFEDLAALGIISKLYFEGLIREVGNLSEVASDDEGKKKPGIEEWLNTGPTPTGGEASVAPSVTPAVALPPAPSPEVPTTDALRAEIDAAEPEVPTQSLEVPIDVVPEPAESTGPRAAVHHFEPKPKGARPTPPPPSREPAPSQFLVAEPPRELERARQRLLGQWAAIEGEGQDGDAAWGATSGWTRYDGGSSPAPENPPVFGGAALERRDLPPLKPVEPPSTPAALPEQDPDALPPEPVSESLTPAAPSRPVPVPQETPPTPPPSWSWKSAPEVVSALAEGGPAVEVPPSATPPTPQVNVTEVGRVSAPTPVPAPVARGDGLEDAFFGSDAATEPLSDELTTPIRTSRTLPLVIIGGLAAGVLGMLAYSSLNGDGHSVADAGVTVVVPPVVEEAAAPPDAGEALAEAQDDAGERSDDAGAAVAVAVAPVEEVPEVALDAGVVAQVAPPAPVDAGAPEVAADDDFEKLVADAKAALVAGRFRGAAKLYREVVKLKPDEPALTTGLGISLVMSDSSFREAVGYLREGVKDDPKNAQAWLALGIALQNLGRDGEAKQPYREFLKLRPSGSQADEVRAALQAIP